MGSTNIRVGSTIFGARDYAKKGAAAAAAAPVVEGKDGKAEKDGKDAGAEAKN
jgi:hypothetical protein